MTQHLRLRKKKGRCQHLELKRRKKSSLITMRALTPNAPSADVNWHMAKESAGLGADTFSTHRVGATFAITYVQKTNEPFGKTEGNR